MSKAKMIGMQKTFIRNKDADRRRNQKAFLKQKPADCRKKNGGVNAD